MRGTRAKRKQNETKLKNVRAKILFKDEKKKIKLNKDDDKRDLKRVFLILAKDMSKCTAI